MTDENTTADSVSVPWRSAPAANVVPVPHLTIAWFRDEPSRVGHSARLDSPCFLGRGEPVNGEPPPIEFRELRPGSSLAAPALGTDLLSRRQLVFEPGDEGGTVRVRNVGRRVLFHNGVAQKEAVLHDGDTLMLEHTAVFLHELRPPEVPAGVYYPLPEFPFGRTDAHGYVGESPAAWRLREELATATRFTTPVLLLGASGSGKELAAAMLHGLSFRHQGPFVARNAATLPASLVDAEVFGSARDYPNSGSPQRDGLIGAANGGYLFLDEIGDLPEEQQAHLLRVLDRGGEYQRLGDPAVRRSNFCLVAATNRDPERLKHDFLARFTTRIRIPGLESRRSDIPFLARELLERAAESSPSTAGRFFDGDEPRLDPLLVEALLRHRYSHQTRELERLLLLAVASNAGEYITLTREVLAELDLGEPEPEEGKPGRKAPTVSAAELTLALRDAGGNVAQAAERLGLARGQVYRLMAKYGLRDAE